jgi:hypothetical protein
MAAVALTLALAPAMQAALIVWAVQLSGAIPSPCVALMARRAPATLEGHLSKVESEGNGRIARVALAAAEEREGEGAALARLRDLRGDRSATLAGLRRPSACRATGNVGTEIGLVGGWTGAAVAQRRVGVVFGGAAGDPFVRPTRSTVGSKRTPWFATWW